MYCPRCGNQPVVDRMRFCPACGFRLDGVVELLARDGAPVFSGPGAPAAPGAPSHRKRGIRRGAKIAFAGAALFLPFLGLSIGVDSPGPLTVPAALMLAGIFWMIYYVLFGEETPVAPPRVSAPPPPQPVYLAPPPGVPVYQPPVEPPRPQSVGEHTTRSLGK